MIKKLYEHGTWPNLYCGVKIMVSAKTGIINIIKNIGIYPKRLYSVFKSEMPITKNISIKTMLGAKKLFILVF